jgi:hypothetical protein
MHPGVLILAAALAPADALGPSDGMTPSEKAELGAGPCCSRPTLFAPAAPNKRF